MLEVVILILTYLIKYVFQIKQDLNISGSNMIAGINESKILIKHISCICKCKFDGRKRNANQCCNINKYRCEGKKHHTSEKDYTWNPGTCSFFFFF